MVNLEETLVRSHSTPTENFDLKVPIPIQHRYHNVYVQVRPGFFNFLVEMSKHYEIVLYTACMATYGDLVFDALDPTRRCTSRLYRQHCTKLDGLYAKDLTLLGR